MSLGFPRLSQFVFTFYVSLMPYVSLFISLLKSFLEASVSPPASVAEGPRCPETCSLCGHPEAPGMRPRCLSLSGSQGKLWESCSGIALFVG